MTDPTKSSRVSRSTAPTTPEDFPTTPQTLPLAALDQSFVLQMMIDLKGAVASLRESVDALKEQVKDHGTEIKQIGKDVHAAKVVGAFIVIASTFLGFCINLLVEYLKKK